tara:strand:+ start:7 stop:159 length:153 start_codon:yes stop_codon:yes gene_type:complete
MQKCKPGIAPIARWNDDLKELSDNVSLGVIDGVDRMKDSFLDAAGHDVTP